MRYEINVAPGAVRELRVLAAADRANVRDALERHLRHAPTRVSKSRIKRLRGMQQPQFRLRAGDIRVFYDVRGTVVDVLAIITKSRAGTWLREKGTKDETRHEEGGAGQDQG